VVIRSSETARLVQQFDVNLNGNVRLIRWTTDGRGLLLTGQDNKGRPGLFRVDAQSGEIFAVGLVDPLKPGEWPDGNWKVSSDGSTFYHHGTPQDCDLKCTDAFFRRDLSSGTETELIRGAQLGGINLSPDDEFIASNVQDSATNSIAFTIIPTKGGKPRQIMREASGSKAGETGSNNKGSEFNFLSWAPDSRSVYVRELLDGKPIAAWRVPVDGTTPQKLDWTIDQFGKGIFVAMQPNGGRMAYTTPASSRADAASQVWVLENFLPARSANNQ
jgi:Tol biopolymer transport system component